MLGRTLSSGWKLAGLLVIVLLTIGVLVRGPRLLSRSSSDQVHFSRDIRPILNQNCMHCHGGVRQKNGVSFLFRDEALGVGKSGRRTIVPGKPDDSIVIYRLESTEPGVMMPELPRRMVPEDAVALLKEWIAQMKDPSKQQASSK